jgi:hypothetical protein
MTVDLQPAYSNTELTALSPAPDPAPGKSAVDRCKDAYELAKAQAKANGRSDCSSILAANKAYREAMPTLESEGSTRDFIACVAHGMLIRAIEGTSGARLLTAAKVAQRGFGPIQAPKPRQK